MENGVHRKARKLHKDSSPEFKPWYNRPCPFLKRTSLKSISVGFDEVGLPREKKTETEWGIG
jgi:hypothetical protein